MQSASSRIWTRVAMSIPYDVKHYTVYAYEGASGSVTVSKLDLQTYTSEFESHWVPHSYGLVPHLSKKLSKLPPYSYDL